MRVVIKDESELPAPPEERIDGMWRFVRSGCDPRAMIHGFESIVYERADGAPWPHAGYKVQRHAGASPSVVPAYALTDDPGEKEAEDYRRNK